MIIKPYSKAASSHDPRLVAGAKAEAQMAHYLNRAFADDKELFVLNNLRLEDAEQPEQNGKPGVCQIDHLVLCRWAAFIIESKSVYDAVTVRDDGSGGDEWTRRYGGREHGFASPIQQARRQGELMRKLLQRHRAELRDRIVFGFRTIHKVMHGTDQAGFLHLPIQIIVAISDGGQILRKGDWKAPQEPFRTYVCKADLVEDKIKEELKRHRAWGNVLNPGNNDDYGAWSMSAAEASRVAAFLVAHDTERGVGQDNTRTSATPRSAVLGAPAPSMPTAAPPAGPTNSESADKPHCKSCGGADLTAHSGKYGYYWKCAACDTNTAMPTDCAVCGAAGQRGKVVRIRKEGPKYYRCCSACGMEERVWTAPE